MAILGLIACDPEVTPASKAYQITALDQVIGGPAADMNVGDFILENDQIRVGILGALTESGDPLYSMGPGLFGGSLVDADLVRQSAGYSNGHGLDQFAELFPTVNLKITGTEFVEVVSDGSDGGPAIVRTGGGSAPYFSLLELLDILCVPATHGYFKTDYILEPGKRYVRVSTTVVMEKSDIPLTYTNIRPEQVVSGANPIPPLSESTNVVDLYQLGGLIIGDFLLMGGDVDIFAPTIGFDEDGAVAENPNTLVQPFALDFVVGTGDRVSYGFVAPKGGRLSVPLFTASQTAAFAGALDEASFENHTNYTVDRYLIVGEGDVASIVDGYIDLHELPHGRVEGNVIDETSGAGISKIHVFVYRDPRPEGSSAALAPQDLTREYIYSEFLTDRGEDQDPNGSFAGNLPVGRWVLMAKDELRPASQPLPLEIKEGVTETVAIPVSPSGNFSFTIRDQFGRLLPAKLSFRAADGSFQAEPILGESFQSQQFVRVYFSPTGEESIALRPGNYQVLVSRGIEYSLYDSATDSRLQNGTITIPLAGKSAPVHLDVTLVHEVNTTGFISADLHVHAKNSFDSGLPLKARVLSMAAEGVEFFAGTDHDYITNYEPVIREAGLQAWVTSVPGDEVTTIELGHMIGFPLEVDPTARSGGAPDWSYLTPTEMLTALKNKGLYGPEETVTQIAHPRDGILGYFDVYGYNPWTNVMNPQYDSDFALRDSTDLNLYVEMLRFNPLFNHKNFTLDFDLIELLNAKRMDLIRTASYAEMNDIQHSASQNADGTWSIDDAQWMYRIIERTQEEQGELSLGESQGGYGLNIDYRRGHLEDWFNLLNYGYKITATGNSDTHGLTSVEAGCPRNYVASSTDEPGYIDPLQVVDSLKLHRSIATYGPFITMDINGHGIGDLVTSSLEEKKSLHFEVQSASWIKLERAELYENGVLIREFSIDPEKTDILKLFQTIELTPKVDSWYVLLAMGSQDLSPVFQSVELPYIELDAVIEDALIALDNEACAGLFGESPLFPKFYPVFPFGLTNPIWVDVDGDTDGDGDPWEPPGHTPWMTLDTRPVTPPE